MSAAPEVERNTGIENNPFPWDRAGLGRQKGGNFARYDGASQHPDLDTGKGDILGQALQCLPHQDWRERLDRADTQRRLHRHSRNAGYAIDIHGQRRSSGRQ